MTGDCVHTLVESHCTYLKASFLQHLDALLKGYPQSLRQVLQWLHRELLCDGRQLRRCITHNCHHQTKPRS